MDLSRRTKMKFLILFALFSAATSSVVSVNTQLNVHWETFKRVFGKSYERHEEATRRMIWEQHVREIVHHNLQADLGFFSFKMGINKYADLGHEEFVRILNGFRDSYETRSNASTWVSPLNVALPDDVDWRREGLVTQVKDQGHCGSCWAFSATGSLESQHKKKTGDLVSLSEQNLIDCSRKQNNHGCDGGTVNRAFRYIIENDGIDTEESYPYTAEDGMCHFKRSSVGAVCRDYVKIPKGDEEALKAAVAIVGPVSVAIDARHKSFHSYSSGIYDEPKCSSKKLDHGVLVIGYGTEDSTDYWLVKNSWGPSWGMDGYIKMSRNKNNQCGITTQASYPVV